MYGPRLCDALRCTRGSRIVTEPVTGPTQDCGGLVTERNGPSRSPGASHVALRRPGLHRRFHQIDISRVHGVGGRHGDEVFAVLQ